MNEWWIDRDILKYRFVYIVFIHCVQREFDHCILLKYKFTCSCWDIACEVFIVIDIFLCKYFRGKLVILYLVV